MKTKDKQSEYDDDAIDNDICEILPENSPEKSSISFKVIIIGNSGVGKTCLSLRALKGDFTSETIPTIGFEFLNLMVRLRDKIISLQIWDTCGQEVYHSVVSKFYKRASMAILIYSIEDRNSFDSLDTWLRELRENSCPEIRIALVGNKCDLSSTRVISKEEALQYKQNRDIDLIFESSAKHGDNSKDIFTETAKILYKDHIKNINTKTIASNSKVQGNNIIILDKDYNNSGGSCTHC